MELVVHQDLSRSFLDNVGCIEWVNGGVAKHFSNC